MAVTGTPSSGDDTLTSDGAGDEIQGLAGNDIIDGGAGNDTIYGDTLLSINADFASTQANGTWGNQNLVGWTNTTNGGRIETWGNDFLGFSADDGTTFIELDSGNGWDRISTQAALDTGSTYTLEIDHAARGGNRDSFEVYVNGSYVGTVTPTSNGYFETASFTITGAAGSDTIEIRELASQSNSIGIILNGISISPTQATVDGSGLDFNDILNGGAGNDKIYGQQGDDIIDGGAGNDYLEGGIGNDIFKATDGQGTDTIADFVIGEDMIDATGITDANGGTIQWDEVIVTSDGQGGSILTFPNGEVTILRGIAPSEIDTEAKMKAIGIGVPCFASGTRILTKSGECKVQNLHVGDLVYTIDRGYQPIKWIGSREIDASGKHAPIVFETGVLGNDRRLVLSPLHRVIIDDPQIQIMFGYNEALVCAKDLVNGETIFRSPREKITYFHIMFEQHEIVMSNGVPTESFFVGKTSLSGFEKAVRDEILEFFPEMEGEQSYFSHHARYVASAAEARIVSLKFQ